MAARKFAERVLRSLPGRKRGDLLDDRHRTGMNRCLLGVVVLLVACTGGGSQTSLASPDALSASPTPPPTTQPLIVPTIAYVMGPDLMSTDYPVFVKRPGEPSKQVASGVQLASVSNVLLTTKYPPGTVTATTVPEGRTYFEDTEVQGDSPQKAALAGDVLYLANHRRIIAVDPSGSVRTVPLPSALPVTTPRCPPRRGLGYDPSRSLLWAITAAHGHVFVYVASPTNGAVVDLQDGRRLDLVDAGHALAMVAGSDGKLYVATVDACASSTVIVRRIDPLTMREEAATDTRRAQTGSRMGLVASAAGIYLHVVGASAELLRIEGPGVSAIALAPDSGEFSAAAPDGTIYLFGGRARNAVTRIDPTTGTLVAVDAARGPAGPLIGALFFPRP